MVSNYRRKTDKASYSKETLREAVRLVKNGSLSGYKAAQIYKIPRMTIMDHVNNKRTKSNTLGRNTALALEEEKRIASCLHVMEKYGLGLTKSEVQELVGDFVRKNNISVPFKNGNPGSAWFTAFKNRHDLSVKKPQAVEYARKKAVNPFIIYPYFDLLEETLKDLNLLDKPAAIWNLDETSFSKDPSKTKVVGVKGHAATRVISSPGKDNTTVLLGANALGEKMPPLIIYKGKNIWDSWTSPEAYPGTTYAATKNGWMETDVFEMYFKKVFLPNVGDQRPILFIYDGHATHVGLNIIEEARRANITILKLPAHTSHVLQPLDISVMKSFKDRWDPILVKWQRLNIGTVLPKKEFARLIGEVWTQIDSQILRNGFRKAGISPFDPKAIEEKHFDSLKLQNWKDSRSTLESQKRHVEPKSLLSLALNCIVSNFQIPNYETKHPSIEQNIPKIPPSMRNVNDPKQQNEIALKNEDLTANKKDKKIQILEDRILTFEELFLMKVKPGSSSKQTRHKVGPGAEVITHEEVLKREMEKKIKKEPKNIKTKTQQSKKLKLTKKITRNGKGNEKKVSKRKASSDYSGPNPICENDFNVTTSDSENDNQDLYVQQHKSFLSDVNLSSAGPSSSIKMLVTKKGKSIQKKCGAKTKRATVASEDSTSSSELSDCMSIYNDSDIFESHEEDNNNMLTPEEKSETENSEEKSNNNILEGKRLEDYSNNDTVLVRYYRRKTWTYYAGYVEQVRPVNDAVYYSIRFYKTVKNPSLKFILQKKIDRDDVPSLSIVKKVGLMKNPDNSKEFFLSNDEDAIYFV